MKDAIHHLKHIQKKVVQSARKEEALRNETRSMTAQLGGEVIKEKKAFPNKKKEGLSK